MSLVPAEVSHEVLAQINAQVLEQISTEPRLVPPPPPENVVNVVLASSLTNVQQQRPAAGTVDREAFVRAYREALRLRKDFPEVYQYLALLYYKMGTRDEAGREERFRRAIATYQEAIDANASASPSYINIGYIHDQLGEHEEATEAYRSAVRFALSSDDFMGLITLGMELLNASRYEEARA